MTQKKLLLNMDIVLKMLSEWFLKVLCLCMTENRCPMQYLNQVMESIHCAKDMRESDQIAVYFPKDKELPI